MNKNIWCRVLLILLLFAPLFGTKTFAQLTELEVGQVYHFTNVNYTAKALGATSPNSVGGVTADNTNKAQLWYVAEKNSSGYYALRNLAFGNYLQANGQSSAWTLATTTASENTWMQLGTANSKNVFKGYTHGNYGYAHIDGSSNIVGWESGAASTQWTITDMNWTSEQVNEVFEQFDASKYQEHLDVLFSDKACTTLNGSLDENNETFKALPITLQDMVRKVAGFTSWEEANKDNTKERWGADYAKKYRVQLYEPYNDAGEAASALGLNAHTNMNNPTGIFANNGDVLYVMVDGEIKEGASLYLAYYKGHDKVGTSSTEGYELKQGLNVIPVFYDESNFCVNYVVQTFDTSDDKKGNKAKARKLSDYKPIKIHIEGGYINGYYNKVGDELYGEGDKNADWDYIEARATQKTVTVLGKYMTLQFPLLDEHTVDTDGNTNKGLASYFNDLVKIEDCINEWDNVMLWERLLLGVLGENTINAEAKKSPYSDKATVFEYTGRDGEFESDYSDYYNIHGLSFGIPNSYMYGGWDHCGYNFNTMGGVIQTLPTNAGSHWGPGHEIGHQHQNLLTVNGLTEVTNNLFANVVLWYFGETTSRYNGSEGALSNVLKQFNAEGTDFFSNNIWSQTIMYYKLFLYYHVLGHNPRFYPRLFEMLRQDPMSTGYNQDGSKCLMHFYKKCCLAAEEDLTEFFRAHGFFEVMDNRLVGDYSNSVYTLTQEQIDAAIKEVKDLKYEENLAVLFVTDATSDEITSHKGGTLTPFGTVCGEYGSYSTFNNNTEANYTYNISGTTMTMEGTGGVGFSILNEKGELIGFSDKKTFEISAEAAAAIASGEASIVMLKGDNTQVATTNVMDAGDNETKYELLGNLLDDAKALLDLSDETGTKVGYYRTSALTDLQTAYTTAKGVYDAKTVAAYSSVYDVLFQEYANLINNEYARINITEGYAYRLTNKAYPGRSMSVNTENNQMFGIETAESDAQLWYFESGATKGTYYLKNKSTQQYPGDVSTSAVLSANKSESDKGKDNGAYAYNLQSMGNGIFALVGSTGLHCSASQNYNIVGWGTDADATQWYITAEVVDETLEARTKLEEVMSKTEALINEMADVQIKGNALDLSSCTITSNTPESGHETQYLVDGDPNTFFHTNWKGTAISANHNIIIDLGEGNSLEQFVLNYTTLPSSSNNVDAPKEIHIYGSNNGSSYTWFASLTGLPTEKGATYTSNILGTIGTAYRYLRFDVTDATGGKLGSYYYFGLAELSLTNPQPIFKSTLPAYTESETTIKTACSAYYTASLTYNNGSAEKAELDAATTTLSEKYNDLLAAYNNVKNASLNVKKQDLQKLIDDANTLIHECGSVTYQPATFNGEAPLQVSDADCDFYVWTNAQSEQEGPISGLIDGNSTGTTSSTYFHTDYSGSNSSDGLDHYINVNLGVQTSDFEFTYTNRPNTDSNYATEMTVLGSTDGTTYEEITSLTDLPAQNGATYTKRITTNKVYSYLRFMVTKNSSNTKKGGHYFFHMAEFDLTLHGKEESYTVTINPNMDEVDEALMLETYHEVAEAQSVQTYATTEAQLDKAIAQLQAQHDALLEAKNNQYAQDLQVKIEETEALIAECGRIENGEVVEVFETAGDATKQQILDAYNQVAEANELINASGATPEQYVEATNALEVLRAALATAKAGTVKSTLRTLTNDVAALITLCGTTPGDVSEVMLNELSTANQEALELLQGDNLTAIAEKTTALQVQYTTVANAQQATSKSTLSSLIADMATLIDECVENGEYVGDVTEALLNTSTQAKDAAQAVIDANNTTTADFTAATETLQGHYDTLLAAKNSTAKAELRAMISDLAELIKKCRITVTNTVTTPEECGLQTTSETGDFYLSTNAGTAEGDLAYLVDGEADTYFQTARSGAGEQYLLVDAGADNSLKKFRFSYRTKMSPFPYTIKVYGSNDKFVFDELSTFDNLPVSTDSLWTSTDISSETAYRYLRFNIVEPKVALKVDEDEVDTSNGEQYTNKFKNSLYTATPAEYCFAMSEFGITNIVDEEQQTEILAGTVTEKQLTDAEKANGEAKTLADESADSKKMSEKEVQLQAHYDALLTAAYQVSLTTTKESDTLLKNIEVGSTIATFSAPYATDVPEGVTAYYAEQATEGGAISLTAIEEGKTIPANEGVILIGKPGKNTVMMLPATSEEIQNITNVFVNSATGPVTMGVSNYILANSEQGIGFYQATPSSTLKKGKAYLHFDNPQQAKSFVLNFGGISTDLDNMLNRDTSDQVQIFDLAGRRVNEVKKGGIYIVNGKKCYIKK